MQADVPKTCLQQNPKGIDPVAKSPSHETVDSEWQPWFPVAGSLLK